MLHKKQKSLWTHFPIHRQIILFVVIFLVVYYVYSGKEDHKFNLITHYDTCVVGAGLSGSVIAHESSLLNHRVLVIDSRDHIGGNCHDYVDKETSILMNKYGAHLFHTNSERVWSWLQRFRKVAPWVRWDHQVIAQVNDQHVPIPVNINTVNVLFNKNIMNETDMREFMRTIQIPCTGSCSNAEEQAMSSVGKDLYNLLFKEYTIKQWNKHPKGLGPSVTARIPIHYGFDNRYFTDKYQALPKYGYTHFFGALLQNDFIDVRLKVNFFDIKEQMYDSCGRIFFTGPIDRYFSSKYGELEYRSINFRTERFFNVHGYKQPNSVVNFPGSETPYTRTVEYKHFLNQQSPHSVTVTEYPASVGDPYYPVPNRRNQQLFEKYQLLAEEEEKLHNVRFVGRLANYKYFNMDQAILNALETMDKLSP